MTTDETIEAFQPEIVTIEGLDTGRKSVRVSRVPAIGGRIEDVTTNGDTSAWVARDVLWKIYRNYGQGDEQIEWTEPMVTAERASDWASWNRTMVSVVSFVAGAILTILLTRFSQRYGRELDSASRLVAAYHRAQEHLEEYRRIGLAPELSAEAARAARAAHFDAMIEFRVQTTMLEMLIGQQKLTAATHEMDHCFERIDGLVDHFALPENADGREKLEGGETDQREIRWRVERVKRQTDVLRATYSRNAMVLPWHGRKRTKAAEEAIAKLGSPPRHGLVVDPPEPVGF